MATLITLALIPCLLASTVLIHYEVLRITGAYLPRMQIRPRQRILVVITACLIAHLLEVALYAAALAVFFHFPALGSIEGEFNGTITDFLYFSFTNYTTLGHRRKESVRDIHDKGSVPDQLRAFEAAASDRMPVYP